MKKILIVEDEKAIRKVMGDMLSDANFEISEAVDGEDGLVKALLEKPDVILLDLNMPKMDGHALLKELRKDPWGATVKVIVLTNQDDAESVGAGFYDGNITDYIIKSNVSLDELKQMVKTSVVMAS